MGYWLPTPFAGRAKGRPAFRPKRSDMPVFLHAGDWVPAPLEASYATMWNVCPKPLQNAVQGNS